MVWGFAVRPVWSAPAGGVGKDLWETGWRLVRPVHRGSHTTVSHFFHLMFVVYDRKAGVMYNVTLCVFQEGRESV